MLKIERVSWPFLASVLKILFSLCLLLFHLHQTTQLQVGTCCTLKTSGQIHNFTLLQNVSLFRWFISQNMWEKSQRKPDEQRHKQRRRRRKEKYRKGSCAWNTAVCTCHVYNPDLPFVIFFLCIPSFLADKTSNKGPPSFKSRTKMTKGWYLLRILYLAPTLLLQEHSKTCFSKNMAQQSDSTLRWSKCTEYSRVLHGLQISTALSCNMFLHVPTTCSHSMFLPDPSSSSSPWTSALYGVCSHHRAPQQVYEVQNCNFSSLFKFFKFFKSFQGELAIAIPAFSPRALCKALL